MTSTSGIHWYRQRPGSTPLVLLHGFTGSPRSWDPVVSALPRARTILAAALPGHHPDMPVAPGFAANIERLADLLDHAQRPLAPCPAAHVAGYSLGARAALALALHRPELVGRLTLIGGHPGLPGAPERAERVRADQHWLALLRDHGIEAFVAAWAANPVFAGQEQATAAAQEAQRRIRLGHDPEALARSLEHMGLGAMPDYRPRLAELTRPVTLITGALDGKFSALARAMAVLMPEATLASIPACGHNPLLEQPAALAALLARLD